MVKLDKRTWKAKYRTKLLALLEEFPKILIVGVDNVRSNQMQQIRIALRGHAEVLMGKNTMIRKAIRSVLSEHPEYEKLLPAIRGNVGFVFTRMDMKECRDMLLSNRVKAPAKAGALAPLDVWVPAGSTGMGPEKTSFFQALAITTKISRGLIEIVSDVHLIKEGEKVGASEAALLNMLEISPFSYGLVLVNCYDNGTMFSPDVLDITEADLVAKFMAGVRNVAACSLAIGYPTIASVPHSIINGFKNVLAIAIATDIDFPAAEAAKAYLANPEAFAVAAAPAASTETAAPAAAAAKEESEESDEDMGFGLFD